MWVFLYLAKPDVVLMLGETLAIITALIWAVSTILSVEALKEVEPIRLNAVNTLFSALIMFPIAFLAGDMYSLHEVNLVSLFLVILSALIGMGVGETLFYRSVPLLGVSRAYTVAFMFPLFTMVLAVLFLGEPFRLKYLAGTCLVVSSTAIISTENKKDSSFSLKGLVLAVTTALLWSTGLILLTLGLRDVSVLLAGAMRYPVVSLLLFVVALSQPGKSWNLNRRNLMIILASVVLGGILGTILFIFSLQLIGAFRATPINASSPVWVSTIASVFMKEKVSKRLLLSSVIMVIGIYFLY